MSLNPVIGSTNHCPTQEAVEAQTAQIHILQQNNRHLTAEVQSLQSSSGGGGCVIS